MLKLGKKQSGFTLIELLIVVIIVAILAGVGAGLLSGNVRRAKLSEADSGLGTVRTALRTMFAEQGSYKLVNQSDGTSPADNTFVRVVDYNAAGTTNTGYVPGISAGDLTGRYFEDDDFTVEVNTAATPQTYCISVTGDSAAGNPAAVVIGGTSISTSAPKGADVNTLARSMNQDGTITNDATCGVVAGP